MRSILIILLSFVSIHLLAQQSVDIKPGDTIQLNLPDVDGEIQWQSSPDEDNWTDIADQNQSSASLAVWDLPKYFRAAVIRENCITYYSETISATTNYMLWSNPDTWEDGTKPVAQEDVVIDGNIIMDDTDVPELGTLTINGTLEFSRKDLSFTAQNIIVNGSLRIGSVSQPFEQNVVITLNGTNNEEGQHDRGIMIASGGSLELHGSTPEVLWTRINQDLPAGSKDVILDESVTWDPNGEVVLAPTDYFEAGNGGAAVTQKVLLTSVEGESLEITEGSNSYRWGSLQYATGTGLSLSSSDSQVDPPLANSDENYTPTVLDERAEIGYLNRNITIQSPNDDLWNDLGFGVHIMIMPSATAHVDGIRISRGGQRGLIRRYPFHWHNLSYSDLQYTEDATGQYFRNSVVDESKQRGIVIHGTNGVEVSNNIVYNIQGHGIFTEDAVERRNIIDHNLVLHVRAPIWGQQLKNHEQLGLHDGGPSGFWLSNPDNIITNNVAADCAAFGFWLSYPAQAWGDHIGFRHEDDFPYQPNRELFGIFSGNVSHSNRTRGIMLDLVEITNDGDVSGLQYASTTVGYYPEWPFDGLESFTLENCVIFKNGHNGFWDRASRPNTKSFVSADNCGRFFAGAGEGGVIEESLVIGTSLNHLKNGTGREALGYADFYLADNGTNNPGFNPSAFATYHHAFLMQNNIIMEFPLISGERSGVFAADDYYLRAVEKGHIQNINNLMINAHPGYKSAAPYQYMTFASAILDSHGYWGTPGEYFVYDDLFLTYDKTVTQVEGSSEESGGVMVPGPFFGFEGFVLFGEGNNLPMNQTYDDLWPIHVSRMNSELNEVATWEVSEAIDGSTLDHMRDFATTPDGIYELTFPDQNNPTDFRMLVDNMLEETDRQVIGIQFDGGIIPSMVGVEAYGTRETYEEVNSLSDVINSDGAVYWQDTENHRVWTKLRGGVWKYWTDDFENNPTPSFEDITYETLTFFIRP